MSVKDTYRHESRMRHIIFGRPRDPNGGPLPSPGPRGYRTPDGYVWGHSLESFFRISVLKNINFMRVYSRSMLKELGEDYREEDYSHPEPRPRIRKPWPVLCSRRVIKTTPTLEDDDHDSDHEDDEDETFNQARKFQSQKARLVLEFMKITYDNVPELELSEFVVENDPANPVKSSYNKPYIKLWAPEFRPFINEMIANGAIHPLDFVGSLGTTFRKVVDENGIMVVSVATEEHFADGRVESVLRFIDPSEVKPTAPDNAVHTIISSSCTCR